MKQTQSATAEALALQAYLGIKTAEEAQELINSQDYSVFTDEEADKQAFDYIEQSLWAFNAEFIIDHISNGANHSDDLLESIKRIQEQCEGANAAIKAMIGDEHAVGNFMADAISADGRGNFISSYDGKENEQDIDGTMYYIYRNN